jgi:hypothetical protein
MRAEIDAFFRSYRDAYNRADAEEVTRHISVPSLLAARDCVAWTTVEQVRDNMKALVAHYRDNGFQRADFVLDRMIEQGSDNAAVDVSWTIERQGGMVPWRFRTGYNLRRFLDGWRIVMCTAYEEQKAREG